MIDDPFDLGQIRVFEAVARCGNFTRAAESLGLAQSSVSQQIQRLEARLGQGLLKRTTRGVELTQIGEATLVYAHAVLGLADQARRQLSEPPLSGLLRLGLVEDFATARLGSIFSIFQQQHPRFELTFETGLSTQLFHALDVGELDVVVAKRLPGRRKGDLLWREPLVWVGHAQSLGEGGHVPLATYKNPSETRDVTLAALRDAGRPWSVVTQSTGLVGITAAVEARLAIAVFGRHFIPGHLQELSAEHSLPSLADLEYVVDRRADAHDDSAVDAFIAILREVASHLIAALP